MRWMATLAMAMVACVATAASGQRAGLIRAGEPFPEITLPDLEGAPRSIAEFRGRKVMLHVFASW